MAGDKYEDMKLDELQDELEERGLSKSGNKPELAARLREHDANQDAPSQMRAADDDSGDDRPTANPDNTTNAPDAADRQKRQADQEINQDPQVGEAPAERSQAHADVLQSLSDERRSQQRAANQPVNAVSGGDDS